MGFLKVESTKVQRLSEEISNFGEERIQLQGRIDEVWRYIKGTQDNRVVMQEKLDELWRHILTTSAKKQTPCEEIAEDCLALPEDKVAQSKTFRASFGSEAPRSPSRSTGGNSRTSIPGKGNIRRLQSAPLPTLLSSQTRCHRAPG